MAFFILWRVFIEYLLYFVVFKDYTKCPPTKDNQVHEENSLLQSHTKKIFYWLKLSSGPWSVNEKPKRDFGVVCSSIAY